MVLGMLVIYVAGSIQLAWIANMSLPGVDRRGSTLIPGDLIKIMAVLIVPLKPYKFEETTLIVLEDVYCQRN